MAQVHKCDLCGKIDEKNPFYNEDYCSRCATRLNDIEIAATQKILKRLDTWYKKGTNNKAAVVEFCHYIMTRDGALFVEQYGTKAWDMLLRAVA